MRESDDPYEPRDAADLHDPYAASDRTAEVRPQPEMTAFRTWNYRPDAGWAPEFDLVGYHVEATDGSVGKVSRGGPRDGRQLPGRGHRPVDLRPYGGHPGRHRDPHRPHRPQHLPGPRPRSRSRRHPIRLGRTRVPRQACQSLRRHRTGAVTPILRYPAAAARAARRHRDRRMGGVAGERGRCGRPHRLRSPRGAFAACRDGGVRLRQDHRRSTPRDTHGLALPRRGRSAPCGEHRQDGGRHTAHRCRPRAVARAEWPPGSRERRAAGESGVVACSALKRAYRDRLRQADPDLRLVYLQADRGTISARLSQRVGHFFSPTLFATQFADLEEPGPDERPVIVPIGQTPAAEVEDVLAAVDR